MDVLLSFVFAFIVCGLLSAVFQAIMMLFKLKPPTVLVIGFSLGSILVPFDMMAPLEAAGGAGMSITVMGAGRATVSGWFTLFAGNAVPLITVICVFLSLAVIGLIAGAIRNKTRAKDDRAH